MAQVSPIGMIKRNNKITFFEEIFPNEFCEEEFLIRSDGNISVGFQVSFPEKESLSEEKILAIEDSLEKVFSRLPIGTTVHFQSQYFNTTGSINAFQETTKGFLSSKMRDYIGDRPILSCRTFLYLCFNVKKSRQKNVMSTFFSAFSIVRNPISDIHQSKVLVKNYVNAFLSQLKSIPEIGLTMLYDHDFVQERKRYFNLDFNEDPKVYNNNFHNKGHEIVVGSKVLKVAYLAKAGNQLYCSTLSDRHVPSFMPWTMGHYLNFPHIVNLAFTIVDTEEELKSLERNKNIRTALGSLQKQIDRMISDDIEHFTQEIRSVSKQMVMMNHNVMTWEADSDQLSFNLDITKAAYTRMNGSYAVSDSFNAGNYFFTFSPGMALDMFSPLLMTLDHALLHFDYTQPTLSDNRGTLLCNRELEPVLVDLWSEKLVNKNRIVIGPSGTGKSFTFNALTSQSIDQGVEVIIIDIGDKQGSSYQNILTFYKGDYYRYSDENPLSFNPFLISKNKAGNYELTGDKKVFLTTLITILWKDTDKGESLSKEEESIVHELLQKFYTKINHEKSTIPRLDRFVGFIEELAKNEDNLNKQARFFDLESFSLVLKKFTSGAYSNVLNSDSNTEITANRLICFDLFGVKSDANLFAVVALIIIELVLDKIRENPLKRKEIIIDEAWSMLVGHLSEFIEVLFRTIRKSNGGVTTISQGIVEIKNSAIGEAIKANAATKILLDHNSQPALIPTLQEFFGFTDHEIELLKSIRKGPNWREIFVMRSTVAQVFAVDLGPHATAAFSTVATERAEIAALTHKAGAEYAINQFVENNLLKG